MFRYFSLLLAHGNEFKVTSIFWRYCFSLWVNCKDNILLLFFLLLLGFFLINKFFSLPSYFLAFSSSVLNENLFYSSFKSVNVSKINLFQIIITINCWSNSFGFKYDIFIFSIFYNKMQDIIKFRCIISITNDIKLKFLSWLQKWMFDFWFKNWDFLSCKSMKLSFNFWIINDCNFESIIFEDFNLSKIKFLRSNSDFRSIWIRTDIQ